MTQPQRRWYVHIQVNRTGNHIDLGLRHGPVDYYRYQGGANGIGRADLVKRLQHIGYSLYSDILGDRTAGLEAYAYVTDSPKPGYFPGCTDCRISLNYPLPAEGYRIGRRWGRWLSAELNRRIKSTDYEHASTYEDGCHLLLAQEVLRQRAPMTMLHALAKATDRMAHIDFPRW